MAVENQQTVSFLETNVVFLEYAYISFLAFRLNKINTYPKIVVSGYVLLWPNQAHRISWSNNNYYSITTWRFVSQISFQLALSC